jgi:hypothetical protein
MSPHDRRNGRTPKSESVRYWHICDILILSQPVRKALQRGRKARVKTGNKFISHLRSSRPHLPGVFATIVIEELAGLRRSQGLNQMSQHRHAFGRG